MSRASISRSYAVLVGIESYTHTRKRVKTAEEIVVHEKDKLLHPEKARRDKEAKQDKSRSAEKERLYLQQQHKTQEQEAQEGTAVGKVGEKLSHALGKLKFRGDSTSDSKAEDQELK